EILNRYPDWKLAVMGYHPEWLKEIPDSQLQLHEFLDVPTYFENLMHLRPMVGLVPLTGSEFNKSKSNIAAQEFTMAGAAVIASPLPEFKIPGVLTTTPEDFVYTFEEVLRDPTYCYHKAIN